MAYLIPKSFKQLSDNLYVSGQGGWIHQDVREKAIVAAQAIARSTDAPVLISKQPVALVNDELEMYQLDLLSNSECLLSKQNRKPGIGKKLNTYVMLNGGRLGVSVYTVINRMANDKELVAQA